VTITASRMTPSAMFLKFAPIPRSTTQPDKPSECNHWFGLPPLLTCPTSCRLLLVRAIAVRRAAGVLALAEPGVAAFFCGEFLGRKARAFMRAVAKRLGGRTTAGAKPIIFSRLKRHLGRRPGRNNRFCTHSADRTPHGGDKQGTRNQSVYLTDQSALITSTTTFQLRPSSRFQMRK